MPFALWITGLPGSGKTTIAKELMKLFKKQKINFVYLSMDSLRKKIVKEPKYTDKEREFAYKKLVLIGLEHIKKNSNVIFDATAHKLKYRNFPRKNIKNFVEIYIKCPLNVCIERESQRNQSLVTKNIYKKAMQRKKGEKMKLLGKVIGIDIPYQKNKNAEITINSEITNPQKAAFKIFMYLKNRLLTS